MTSALKNLSVVTCALIVCGCGLVDHSSEIGQTPAEVREIQRTLVPVVKKVPSTDRETLWKATEGYMQRAFAPTAIRMNDVARMVIETHLLEVSGEGKPARTQVTVQVADDPEVQGGARLGVIAQRIDAQMDFAAARSGKPVPTLWLVRGNDEAAAEVVASEIMQRYLLLRAGRDPDVELPTPRRIGEVVPDRDPTQPVGVPPIR
jgi:hypothetical protein